MTDPLTLYRLFDRGRLVGRGRRIRCFGENGLAAEEDYEAFAAGVARFVQLLTNRGLRPGERIATLAANDISHLQMMWAAPLAGGVFHAINPRLSEDEIAYIIGDADDRFLFADPVHASLARSLREARPGIETFVFGPDCYDDLPCTGDETPFRSDMAFEIPQLVEEETAPAVLCYTSGTTGRPKGVVYSHRALTLHAMTEAMVDGYRICNADHVLLLVPFCHGAGWGVPYSAFMCGADISLLAGPIRPARVADILTKENITFTGAVPEVIGQIAPEIEARNLTLPGLRILMGGTAPRPQLLSILHEARVRTMLCWGMTETLSAATMQHLLPEADLVAPTQGQPLPLTELKLGPDGAGELFVRGPCVVETYYNQGTSARDEGWFATGDVASIDADGSLRLQDRKKDLIKSGGEWISPAALEKIVSGIPGIRECAVVGLPHPKWGERPLCVVASAEDVSLDVVADALKTTGRFAKWQMPDDVVTLDALPRTVLNKLDRQALRKAFRNRFDREES